MAGSNKPQPTANALLNTTRRGGTTSAILSLNRSGFL
jgi:hypothetical protein